MQQKLTTHSGISFVCHALATIGLYALSILHLSLGLFFKLRYKQYEYFTIPVKMKCEKLRGRGISTKTVWKQES